MTNPFLARRWQVGAAMARRAAAHPSDAEGRVLSHLRALLQPRGANRQPVTSPSRVAAPDRASNTGPRVGVEGVYGALDVKSGVYMGRQMSDVGRAMWVADGVQRHVRCGRGRVRNGVSGRTSNARTRWGPDANPSPHTHTTTHTRTHSLTHSLNHSHTHTLTHSHTHTLTHSHTHTLTHLPCP